MSAGAQNENPAKVIREKDIPDKFWMVVIAIVLNEKTLPNPISFPGSREVSK